MVSPEHGWKFKYISKQLKNYLEIIGIIWIYIGLKMNSKYLDDLIYLNYCFKMKSTYYFDDFRQFSYQESSIQRYLIGLMMVKNCWMWDGHS